MRRVIKDVPFVLLLTLSPFLASQELSAQSAGGADTATTKKGDTLRSDDRDEVEKEEDSVFMEVEKEPSFPGGERAMVAFIREELEYPPLAKEMDIEGVVYISFVVWKDGELRKVRVRKGVNRLLDQEALQVVEKMPDWEPGMQEGETVPVQVALPIRFKLTEKEKEE